MSARPGGKSERNIHLLRKRLDAEPENVGLWVHLGNELNSIGETEEARSAADQAWSLITQRVWIGVPPHMVQAFTLRARMQWDANELTDLAATVEYTRAVMQSANSGPLHPNVYFLDGIASENLALYAQTRRQRWELLARAAGCYETLSRLANGRWTAFVIPEILGSRGRIRFAGVLVQLGQFEHALSVLTPDDAEGPAGQLVQAEALLGLGRTSEARAEVECMRVDMLIDLVSR